MVFEDDPAFEVDPVDEAYAQGISAGWEQAAFQVKALRAQLASAKAVLTSVEWVSCDGYHNDCCPLCEQVEPRGHKPDCKLAAALAEKGGE